MENDQFTNKNDADLLQTKCNSCGGYTEYSPAEEQLLCLHCGSKVKLDLSQIEVEENDFDYWKEKSLDELESETTEVKEVKCKQCGATTTLEPNTTSSKCAFCDTPIVLSEAVINRFWTPEYILPFKIPKNSCDDIFNKWLGSRWFIPTQAKKLGVNKDLFKGVYMPFWTYDAYTTTSYQGERGEYETEEYESNGETKTRTITEWYHTSGTVEVDFDDVIVPASDTLPKHISSRLTQWDKENLVAYRKEFLAGFITEIYNINFVEALDLAKSIMDNEIDSEIRRDIGGDQQRINSKYTNYEDIKFKHLLLPIWISAFKYKDKQYQYVINGRSGEVFGEYPKSVVKITAFVLAIIAVIVILYQIFN